jgi:hypothetical protein
MTLEADEGDDADDGKGDLDSELGTERSFFF